MSFTECMQALSKAKIQLMSRPSSAFFTTLCFSLKHSFSDTVPTAYTDGKNIVYGTKFFMELSMEEQVFLMLHETLHVAYLHTDPVRLSMHNKRKWNEAADHVINLQLIASGFKMPSGKNAGLADPQYKGMSTEQVYALLPEPQKDEDMGGFGEDLQESPMPSEELQAGVQDILVRASIQSKMANDKPGTIPGEIQIFLDRLLAPKLPWNRILQKYLQTFSKSDYTFKKPNRRHFPTHYLPTLHSESLMDIAIAVDISGSVTDTDFNRFITETHSILRMMRPNKITLVQFDTEIKSTHAIRSVQELMQVEFKGRGGTYISPVLEWANENKPQLLLVFSDGDFRFYDYETKVKTLWLIHDNPNFQAPYGKVIHYSME